MVSGNLPRTLQRDIGQGFLNERFSQRTRGGRGIVHQILLEGHQGVGRAAQANFPALAQAHEAVSCAAFPVAGRAETGDVPGFQQPADHFI